MAIWYIFPRFGTFYPFWYVVPRTIWQPCSVRIALNFLLLKHGFKILSVCMNTSLKNYTHSSSALAEVSILMVPVKKC
jgi:hypothetical protein